MIEFDQNTMVQAWFACAIILALALVCGYALSGYLNRVMAGERTGIGRVLQPVERVIYKALGTNPQRFMPWKRYLLCVIAFSVVSFIGLFAILMLQGVLPGNPEHLPSLSWDLALNTAASYVANANWQAYSGEQTMSYLSQAVGLAVQNVVTPAVGIAVVYALFRGMMTDDDDEGRVGNFWADVTRAVLYVILPLCLAVTLVNVSQGVPQTFDEYQSVSLLEPLSLDDQSAQDQSEADQSQDQSAATTQEPSEDGAATSDEITQLALPLGPVASQVAPKQLGSNGGGYMGANGASILENPTPLSNVVQSVSIIVIPIALVFAFGRYVSNRKQGYVILGVMLVLFVAALAIVGISEQAATPALTQDGNVYIGGTNQSAGNMEGKETRFGVQSSAFWTMLATGTSNGSANASLVGMTPITTLVSLVLMGMGEVVFGGVGSGLCSMLCFAILTVFVAGLMVGRTPEYMGKKIGPSEMRMAALVTITTPILALVAAALMALDPQTTTQLNAQGALGFTQVLYAAISTAAANGSALSGFEVNTEFLNTLLAFVMLASRFIPIVCVLLLAGSLAKRARVATSAGTLATESMLFGALLLLIIIVVGALALFPALALGPVAGQLQMLG